jgi:hypothetical protein
MSYFIPIILLLASAVGLVVATGNASKITPDALQNLIPNFSNDLLEDINSGSNLPKWNNDGSGLELEILNALDDTWQVAFSLTVADWDFGNPDALTLRSQRVDYDPECTSVDGTLKVCNGDYGDTKWRGINQVVTDDSGYITASSARMNEFYLQHDTEDAKQYTICHEIGHGFGLPHTDEDFDNEDLGNCMDYTNNWDVNKHPDETNYEFLLGLYGPTGGRRLVRRHPFRKVLPEKIRRKLDEVVSQIEQRDYTSHVEDGWKLLHRAKHGEEHEMELGEGYKVRVHLLLA